MPQIHELNLAQELSSILTDCLIRQSMKLGEHRTAVRQFIDQGRLAKLTDEQWAEIISTFRFVHERSTISYHVQLKKVNGQRTPDTERFLSGLDELGDCIFMLKTVGPISACTMAPGLCLLRDIVAKALQDEAVGLKNLPTMMAKMSFKPELIDEVATTLRMDCLALSNDNNEADQEIVRRKKLVIEILELAKAMYK